MRKARISSILLALLVVLPIFPVMAGDTPAAKPRKLHIQDGERLRYGNYIGGERYQDISIVSRYSADGKFVNVYIGKHFIGTGLPMPAKYGDYQRQFVIALDTASMIRSFGDYNKEMRAENKTGEVAFDTQIDLAKNLAVYVSKIWDGYELRTKTTRVKLKPGYPVWDAASLAFVGSRYLDLAGNGIVYGVYPTVVKEAVPISARFLKKETIETPLGKFATLKYGIGITDPFLAQLLDSYVKEVSIWIEDSPRALVIKTYSPQDSYILEEISELKD